ncbi:NlpC/P60 family protein [Lutispora thermophila]|nr:NlpC/P60 family protein [Lutispora thermophila]
MKQLMRKICSKNSLVFMFIIIAITIITNITYADSALQANYQVSLNKEDIPSEWAKEEIYKAKQLYLIPEKIQGEYGKNITREEFSEAVIKLYEALKAEKYTLETESPFIDTQNPEVIKANRLGIVKGVGEGKFAPDEAITRQDISVMMYRTLKAAKPGYDYSIISNHVFGDQNIISPWAREAVAYLYGIEVINGVGGNMFNPLDNTSREEAIVLIKRMYDKAIASGNSIIVSREGTSRRELAMKMKLEELIAQEMGKPYQWGGTGPKGYDCSGLVYSIYGKLGIALPRTASAQSKVGTYVPKESLAYGDLVFFARDGKNVHHVGIYVGNGEFVHSPQTGDVVKKTTLLSGYYQKCYYTAKRVF